MMILVSYNRAWKFSMRAYATRRSSSVSSRSDLRALNWIVIIIIFMLLSLVYIFHHLWWHCRPIILLEGCGICGWRCWQRSCKDILCKTRKSVWLLKKHVVCVWNLLEWSMWRHWLWLIQVWWNIWRRPNMLIRSVWWRLGRLLWHIVL